MPESVTDAPAPREWSYIWWCLWCRRSQPFTAGDLALYARTGWPVCCGHKVMCHYAEQPTAAKN